ncbi:hypothetical protein R3P38DRAFT_3431846 [Favolaschia claudopus]|uniref:Ubiquitin-like domain-containing protein n=1 Tax=Favolaschia claudopus TaxID=2862362 RepID=A0AAW0CW91_9AGAR
MLSFESFNLLSSTSASSCPSVSAQRLLFKGKALADAKLVKEYPNLLSGETVNLVLKPTTSSTTEASPAMDTLPAPKPTLSTGDRPVVSAAEAAAHPRRHTRIPSVVLFPSPSHDNAAGFPAASPGLPAAELSTYHEKLAEPEFWEALLVFLKCVSFRSLVYLVFVTTHTTRLRIPKSLSIPSLPLCFLHLIVHRHSPLHRRLPSLYAVTIHRVITIFPPFSLPLLHLCLPYKPTFTNITRLTLSMSFLFGDIVPILTFQSSPSPPHSPPSLLPSLTPSYSSSFPAPADAARAWEDFLRASKNTLTASEVARIRDRCGVSGMAGT